MSTLDERKSKSFDVVLDTVKLLITLNTAIIGYMVSAILIHKDANDKTLDVLKAHSCATSWSLYVFAGSVFFGLLTILKITGILGNENTSDANVSIYDPATRLLFFFCLLCFLVAIVIIGNVAINVLP